MPPPTTTERHDTREGMARNALLMSAATMVSRFTGLAREMVFAGLLGTSEAASVYAVAVQFPNQMRQIFAEGAMSAAFVPMLAEAGKVSRERAWEFARRFLWSLGIVVALMVAGCMLGAGAIMQLLAPSLDSELFALGVLLTRWIFPFLLLVSLSALLGAVLNYFGSFFVPDVAQAIFNTVMIVWAGGTAMTLFQERPVLGFGTGWIVGGVVMVLVQLPLARKLGMDFRPAMGFRDPLIVAAGALMVPRIAAYGVQAVNLIVAQQASTKLMGEAAIGYPAILNYAVRLAEFVLGGFVTSIATVILPTMSRQVVGERRAEYAATINASLRVVAFITVPASFALFAIGPQVVAAIFQRGRFAASSTAITASALAMYCLALMAMGCVRVLIPAFYALKDTWTPFGVALTASIINVFLMRVMVDALGFRGIPLTLATIIYFQLVLLLLFLRRKVGPLGIGAWLASVGRAAVASAAMTAVLHGLVLALPDPGTSEVGRILHLAALITAGVAAYMSSSWMLRSRELREAWEVASRKLARRRASA